MSERPARIPDRDLVAVQRSIAELYELGGVETFQARVIRALAPVVPGDMTVYAEIDLRSRQMSWNAEAEAALGGAEARRTYAAHISDLPMLGSYRRGRGPAAKISDTLTRREFHRTAIYNEFYRRVGLEHHIAKGLPGPEGVVTALAILRPRRDFTERDRLVLNLLGPHLNQAYENATAATRMGAEVALLRRGFDAIDQGIVVLADDGRVTAMSERAHRWCADYFGRTGGGLPDALRRWVRDHDHRLARRDEPAPAAEPLRVARDGRELTVRIVRDGAQRLLLLSEHERIPRPERLATLGLSRREAEVLAWVAEGKSNGDVATILGTSVRTVDKHLEHVFRKLGVETCTAAASRARDLLRG